MAPKASKKREPEWLSVDRLLIDPENFRFGKRVDATQNELLQIMDRDYQIEQIGESLADNGFFPQEPLVAIRQNDKFVVIEGNRRLAALKLLLGPKLRHLTKNKGFWEKLQDRMKYEITEVPVIVYDTREELTSFLGYRHVASTMPWEPLAKARYIVRLVEKRRSFKEVSDETGTPESAVRKHYVAYRALMQARRKFGIETSKVTQSFSLFFRALGHTSIARYVGLKSSRTLQELKAPILPSKRARLAEVISYIYGSRDERAAMPESRDLKRLGEILSDNKARRVLETTRDFQKAYSYVGGEPHKLSETLLKAGTLLDEALSDLHRNKQNREVIEAVQRLVESFKQIMKHFPDLKVTSA